MTVPLRRQAGFSLMDSLMAAAIGALLLLAVAGAAQQAAGAWSAGDERATLQGDAAAALQRMALAVRDGGRVLEPFPDNPDTAGRDESQRSLLAVALGPWADRDGDGVPDADNDGDGRVDEDLPADANFDGVSALDGLDFNGDGTPTNGAGPGDDDEDGRTDEDPVDGRDDDGDGTVDEDPPARMAGGAGSADDDGDGRSDEDWLDLAVYVVRGGQLVERLPDLGGASGRAWTERVIAEGVTAFQARRIAAATGERAPRLELSLTLTGAGGLQVSAAATLRLRVLP